MSIYYILAVVALVLWFLDAYGPAASKRAITSLVIIELVLWLFFRVVL